MRPGVQTWRRAGGCVASRRVCVPGTQLDAQSAAMTPTGDATTTTTWTSNYYTASAAVLPAHDAREYV